MPAKTTPTKRTKAAAWLSADGVDVPLHAKVKTVPGATKTVSGTVTARHAGGTRVNVLGKDGKNISVDPATVTIGK